MSSTIFAPITGRGGAVSVIRLSGPEAFSITTSLAGHLPPPRRAALRTLARHDAENTARGVIAQMMIRLRKRQRVRKRKPLDPVLKFAGRDGQGLDLQELILLRSQDPGTANPL